MFSFIFGKALHPSFHAQRRLSSRKRRPSRFLEIEPLESRTLLAGNWTPLTNLLPDHKGAQLMLLLSDGTVMAKGAGITTSWYQLTPDSDGNYLDGTWSQLSPMSTPRLYFGSAVLPSGQIFVLGGEYSNPLDTNDHTEISTGEIYDPLTNQWTAIAPYPTENGHVGFGDDETEVLPDGQILAGGHGPDTYIYDPTTNSWSSRAAKLYNDTNSEESWVKLADGSILSFDLNSTADGFDRAQRYLPSTNTWVDAGTVPVPLSVDGELGPAFLMPDGRALFFGANGLTAFYTPPSQAGQTGTWQAGNPLPSGLGAADVPGAMLPNGDVLIAAGPDPHDGGTNTPTTIFEFDPTANSGMGSYTTVTPPSSILSPSEIPSHERMLVLPSGQVLLSNFTNQLTLFTPAGAPNAGWQPTVSSVVADGSGTFTLTGTQLNGISEGAAYGDDAQMATNYPIVQLTDASGHVIYARTFNWSSTGVATGDTPVTTQFTLPYGLAPGDYSLVVSANGISSTKIDFSPPPVVYADTRWAGLANGTVIPDADPVAVGNQPATIGVNAFASVNAGIAAANDDDTVEVNGADGSGNFGNYNEAVNVNKPITLLVQYGPVTFNSLADSVSDAGLSLDGVNLTLGGDNTSTTIDGTIVGSGSLTKEGGGSLILAGSPSRYTGSILINQGTLIVNGALPEVGAVVVNAGTTLGGTGSIQGTVYVENGGTLSPGFQGPGTLTTGNVSFQTGAVFQVDLQGPVAGTGHSRLIVDGLVGLGNATLQVDGGFSPAPGSIVTLILNRGPDPVYPGFNAIPFKAT